MKKTNIEWLDKAIEEIIKEHPEYGTKKGAIGNCIIASDKLLFRCDEIAGETIDGYLIGDKRPHHWAIINGNINVDLTARQFDEQEEFPKIWIENEK